MQFAVSRGDIAGVTRQAKARLDRCMRSKKARSLLTGLQYMLP